MEVNWFVKQREQLPTISNVQNILYVLLARSNANCTKFGVVIRSVTFGDSYVTMVTKEDRMKRYYVRHWIEWVS